MEVEAENGRMRGRHGRRGSRVKGKGREGERAGPPNEPPEKRRRWEYWSGMPATGCLERSPLPSLLYQYHPLSSFLPSMHTNALPSLFRPSLFALLAPVFFLYSKRSSSPSTPIPETLTKPRITRLPLASSSISDLRSSVLWFHATSSSFPLSSSLFENIKTTPRDCLLFFATTFLSIVAVRDTLPLFLDIRSENVCTSPCSTPYQGTVYLVAKRSLRVPPGIVFATSNTPLTTWY